MKIVTIWNLKGGTGKTTTTFNLAANMSKDNKILLLDLDMQANLTSFFDIDTKKYKTNRPDIAALLSDDEFADLISRNNELSNKAEKLKNEDKLFMMQLNMYLPSAVCCIKMICDFVILFVTFFSSSMSIIG